MEAAGLVLVGVIVAVVMTIPLRYRRRAAKRRAEKAAVRAARRARKSAVGQLTDRVGIASHNVTIAIDDAQRRDVVGSQLTQAIANWDRASRSLLVSLDVAGRLHGDAQTAAAKALKPRVDDLERVATQLVTVALSEDTDVTFSSLGPLTDASTQLAALQRAQRELAPPSPGASRTFPTSFGQVVTSWRRLRDK